MTEWSANLFDLLSLNVGGGRLDIDTHFENLEYSWGQILIGYLVLKVLYAFCSQLSSVLAVRKYNASVEPKDQVDVVTRVKFALGRLLFGLEWNVINLALWFLGQIYVRFFNPIVGLGIIGEVPTGPKNLLKGDRLQLWNFRLITSPEDMAKSFPIFR